MRAFTLENAMNTTRKLWIGLGTLLVVSFSVLLWAGGEIFRAAPPMPEKVLVDDGSVLYTRADIETGREVWQSIGGMQLGDEKQGSDNRGQRGKHTPGRNSVRECKEVGPDAV